MKHYPKMKYSKAYVHGKPGGTVTVHSEDEENKLGGEWKDSPADHGVVTAPSLDQMDAKEMHLKNVREEVRQEVIGDLQRQKPMENDEAERRVGIVPLPTPLEAVVTSEATGAAPARGTNAKAGTK